MPVVVFSIKFQMSFYPFVTLDAVKQHNFIQLLITELVEIHVAASDSKWGTGVAIGNRF